MDNTVWTVTRATVDGVLFRTRPNQKKKKVKTDNSCMVGEVNVSLADGRQEKQKCYGVIKRFFCHFMYPPPKAKTYKLNPRTLAALNVPWILCAECDWYEHLGEQAETGIVRIQPNPFWEASPIHNMANTLPVNAAFWPEVSFDPNHFTEEGVPQENVVHGQYDFSGLTNVLNVIYH